MSTPERYVCGFAFDPDGGVLLSRNKRGMYEGLLNGPGGKVAHPGESYRTAIRREVLEETGLDISVHRWAMFHQERFRNGNEVFYHFANLSHSERPVPESEESSNAIWTTWKDGLVWRNCAPGLSYLIPMAYELLKRPVWDRPL